MTQPADVVQRFTSYLEGLLTQENGQPDRAALAALRRGLGKDPGEAPEMYPFIVPWLPADVALWRERTFYTVASLFAFHQLAWHRDADTPGLTNFGASMGWLARASESKSTEARFIALLNATAEDLPDHLRRAIGLLRAHDVPVDWPQLLRDLQNWDREDRRVQRAWARGFWVAVPPADTAAGDGPDNPDDSDTPAGSTDA